MSLQTKNRLVLLQQRFNFVHTFSYHVCDCTVYIACVLYENNGRQKMREICNQRLGTKPCADNCKLNFLSYLLCSGGVRFPGGKEINMSYCVSDPSPCVHSLHSLLCRLCPHPPSDPAFNWAQWAQNSTEVRIQKKTASLFPHVK